MTQCGFRFTISSIPFDEDYRPADDTRITTNFANLARGESRRENLRNTLAMMDNRLNSLLVKNNARGDRYALELEIVSASLELDGGGRDDIFPLIEILKTTVVDRTDERRIDGMVGNNFSSYVRDYDFSIVLPSYLEHSANGGVPASFGKLHGDLFKSFLASRAYRENFAKPPVICLSVSSRETYRRTARAHPVLGAEYSNDSFSRTDEYFSRMGMKVRYFMPPHAVAPLALYHIADLFEDYTDIELASVISTMETFQKIYRPEIYNANSVAADHCRPSLTHRDYSLTRIVYDREERGRLAVEQGKFTEEKFIKPYGAMLDRWSATCGL